MKTLTKTLALAGAALAVSAAPAAAGPASPPAPAICAQTDNMELGSVGACVSSIVTEQLSGAAYIANCKALESEFAASNESGRPYPYTFYGDVPVEELPFPEWPRLTAKNRAGCVAALRVYHGLFG